jgi:anti-sigma regulatory factor (Ser/Thr protein kinase)
MIEREKRMDEMAGEVPTANIVGEIVQPAVEESVPVLLDFVAEIERREGFEQDRIDEIATALTEAFRIAIRKAYRATPGDIKVVCKYDYWRKLVIVVSDKGEPYNILLADVTFPMTDEDAQGTEDEKKAARPSKKLVATVEYKRADGENILTCFVGTDTRRKPR